MNLRELIEAFRDDTGDNVVPYRVSDSKAKRFANRAQVEASRRSRMLVDSTDDSICRVDFDAGDPNITIDQRIISIRRASIQGSSVPLAKRVIAQMDEEFPGWYSSESRSTPFIIIVDVGTNEVRLYPTPKSSGTVHLTVTREPKRPMSSNTDVPELPARCHEALVEGMKMYAYSSDDPDLADKQMADLAEAAFEAEFGKQISGADERFEFENYHDIGER